MGFHPEGLGVRATVTGEDSAAPRRAPAFGGMGFAIAPRPPFTGDVRSVPRTQHDETPADRERECEAAARERWEGRYAD
jgi:hypothetical protein